jgi:hypothetical protein
MCERIKKEKENQKKKKKKKKKRRIMATMYLCFLQINMSCKISSST